MASRPNSQSDKGPVGRIALGEMAIRTNDPSYKCPLAQMAYRTIVYRTNLVRTPQRGVNHPGGFFRGFLFSNFDLKKYFENLPQYRKLKSVDKNQIG